MNAGFRAYESHQSRYPGPKKAPSMSRIRGLSWCIQPDGTGSMQWTIKGSQRRPGLPVMQHLFPSRKAMSFRILGVGAGGGQPCCDAWTTRLALQSARDGTRWRVLSRLTTFHNISPVFRKTKKNWPLVVAVTARCAQEVSRQEWIKGFGDELREQRARRMWQVGVVDQ